MPSDDSPFNLRRLAALLGASGVAMGAFGAHALKDTLSKKNGAVDNWKTATMYQLFHAAAILGVSALADGSEKTVTAGQLMAAGTVLFSGSIYGLCLDVGPKKLLGPTTPIGGLLLIGGWVVLGLS